MEKTKNACDISGERKPESPMVFAENDKKELAEHNFYQKLVEFHESSGLNSVFNVRETKFDLHFLYEEVTKRGGFYQVMKNEKWDEVKSSLNLRSSEFMLPAQLQKVYEIHLLPFEQACWKMTDESNLCSDTTFPAPSSFEVAQSCSTGKRKKAEDGSKITDDSCDVDTGCKKVKSNKSKRRSSNAIDKESDALPTKPRTGYQIFLRLESRRLRMIRGENSGNQKSRDMAVHAWNSLSDEGKKPYIDASKMDKERYAREMEEYNESRVKNENANNDCLRDNNDPRKSQLR